MSGRERIGDCLDCGRRATIRARRLCCTCYYHHVEAGDLDDFPRVTTPSIDLVEDYEFLVRYEGLTRRLAAERMGVSLKRLEKAIERHSRRMQAAS